MRSSITCFPARVRMGLGRLLDELEGEMAETAVTKPEPNTLRAFLEGEEFKTRMAQSLGSRLDPVRFGSIVLAAVSKTPNLIRCTIQSVAQAFMDCAALGLEPNTPLGLAYVIPYNVFDKAQKTKVYKAQLQIGYRGLVELAWRSGKVSIRARLVHAKDEFDYETGLVETLRHRFDPFSGDRGEVRGGYAVATIPGAEPKFEVMSRHEIDAIRKRSRASDEGPWVTDWPEMAKKTIIRRLCKTMPLTGDLKEALEREDLSAVDNGFYVEPETNPRSTPLARLQARTTKSGKTVENPPAEAATADEASHGPEGPPESSEGQEGPFPAAESASPGAAEIRAEIEARIAKIPKARRQVFAVEILGGVPLEEIPDSSLSMILDVLDSGEWG